MTSFDKARELAVRVAEAGGCTYFVGGCVRDRLMGRDGKDVDVEVHGIEPDVLRAILDELGTRTEMGASFGIFGLAGYDLDVALPRKEEATGSGHRDFDVIVDPRLGTEKAARRRDFTINALMEDVLTGEVLDHYHGREDLARGIIRHVDDASFAEDPLRVLRAAQFAARFGYEVAPETCRLMASMDLSALPAERIMGELEKALLKADRPSRFFEVLREVDQLEGWFGEVAALIGVPQPPNWHPEGDAWTHTLMVVDAAAGLRDEATWPLGLMLSALCHDLGKATTTTEVDGRIHSLHHEIEGIPLARALMERVSGEKRLVSYVLNMVELHMRPNMMVVQHAKQKGFNKVFDLSVCPADLLLLAKADFLGCGGATPEQVAPFERAEREHLAAFEELMARPFVQGRDLIEAGLEPGPRFGEILAYAHKLRLAGVDKDSALRQTLGHARSLK